MRESYGCGCVGRPERPMGSICVIQGMVVPLNGSGKQKVGGRE